jgi:anti-sigma B factor antagonist
MDEPGDAFRIDEHRTEDAVVLTLHGELDLASADGVQQRLDALAAAHTPVRLDLDGLRFMDSSGLRVVLQAAETSRATGWAFTITPGSEQVRTLFASAGITGRLPIVGPE